MGDQDGSAAKTNMIVETRGHQQKGGAAYNPEQQREKSWLHQLLGLFVIDDLQRVRRKDQRKACRCYCVLLVIYLAAMLQMTVSTFQHRRGPPTSIELIEDQAWTSPPPPNMILCPTFTESPRWLLSRYRAFDRNAPQQGIQWVTPDSYREGVRVMECGSYAGRCVFVMGAKEGPTRDLHRPTQEASLSVRVGYTFPPRSPGDDRPLPLGVSMWFTHAHDPRELCREEARGASAVDGYTVVSAHLHGPTPGSVPGSRRNLWPYDVVVLERTQRAELHPDGDDKLNTHLTNTWRYTTRVAPLQTLGEAYGHNYTMALLNSTEAQAFLSHCDGLMAQATEGNETAALDACLHDEIRRRSQELEAAGDRGLYLHIQLWLSKQEVSVTQTDPVNILELLSQWSGAWGWVTVGFGIFFIKTYYDTYAACPCLRRGFWGLKRKTPEPSTPTEEHSSDCGDETDQETPKLGRKILRELSFKAVKLRSAAMLPEPSFGSVYLDLQELHQDLRSMQQWYLQCRLEGRLLPPPPCVGEEATQLDDEEVKMEEGQSASVNRNGGAPGAWPPDFENAPGQ